MENLIQKIKDAEEGIMKATGNGKWYLEHVVSANKLGDLYVIKDSSYLDDSTIYKNGKKIKSGEVEFIENGDIIVRNYHGDSLFRKDGTHIITANSVRYEGNNKYYAAGTDYHGWEYMKEANIEHTDKGTKFEAHDHSYYAESKIIPWGKINKIGGKKWKK